MASTKSHDLNRLKEIYKDTDAAAILQNCNVIRIVLPEVNDPNGIVALQAMNVGHPGSIESQEEHTMSIKPTIDFTPRFHSENSEGNWQLKPIDPRLVGAAGVEAKCLEQAGQNVVVLDMESNGFRPAWVSSKD